MGDTETPTPNDLRTQLEAANAARKAAEDKAEAMELDIRLRDEANLGHLNQRQRRTVLRDVKDEGEFSAEAARKIAEEHGYALDPTPASPPTDNGTTTNPAPVNETPNPAQPSPADESLDAFSHMAQAQAAAVRGNVDPDFEAQVKATKSPAELTALIRAKGAASGVVHTWDTQ